VLYCIWSLLSEIDFTSVRNKGVHPKPSISLYTPLLHQLVVLLILCVALTFAHTGSGCLAYCQRDRGGGGGC